MSHTDCPYCGERNFAFLPTTRIDRCHGCGRTLAADSELAQRRTRAQRAFRRFRRQPADTTPVGPESEDG